ncbi:MAG TPA: hypothetical protein VFM18_13720 [Methanosarcina sp.]|nr:hypothetical protein [Methanosarcina sp.]
MTTFITSILLTSTEVLWAILGKLVTKTFLESIITKLTLSGLEKLAASTSNQLDDSIVADVKKALETE